MENTLTSLDRSLSIIIDGATEKGTKLVDFIYAEAPEVIQQFLLYHGIEFAAKFLLGLFLIFGAPFVFYKIARFWCNNFEKIVGEKPKDHPGFWLPTILTMTLGILFTQIGGWKMINLQWLKIWIAPKVYLLEYLGNLSK